MKPCVLLVAHQDGILDSLPHILQAAGHHVLIAGTGIEALNKVRRTPPSLIIMDATLPDMDGATACEILSRLPSTQMVPRILLTGCAKSAATTSTEADCADIVRRVRQVLFHKNVRREERMIEPEADWSVPDLEEADSRP